MKSKKLQKTTTNRGEFNRAYKDYLQSKKIRCSHCKYHRGENKTDKWYGGFELENMTYPNWKLVSKKKKQWENKSIKIVKTINRWNKKAYCEIKF